METKDKNTELLEGIVKDLGKLDEIKTEQANLTASQIRDKKEFSDKVDEINQKSETSMEQMRAEILALKAKGGRFGGASGSTEDSAMDNLKNGFKDNFDKLQKIRSGTHTIFETKSVGDMTAAANLTGGVVQTYTGVVAARPKRKVEFRDLTQVFPSATGLWKFYRQNTPAGEGSFQFQTTHGTAKQELDYDLTEELVTVDYLAGYARIAKQMLQDLPYLQSFVANQLIEDFLRSESANFFDTLQNGATTTGTTSASVTVEKIVDYVASLAAADWETNAIVTTPATWASIIKTKPSNYSIPGGVTITDVGDISIMGIPLVKSNNITAGKILLGNWDQVAIIQSEGLSVTMSAEDQDNFIKNMITVKCEARENVAILRPDAFVFANA